MLDGRLNTTTPLWKLAAPVVVAAMAPWTEKKGRAFFSKNKA